MFDYNLGLSITLRGYFLHKYPSIKNVAQRTNSLDHSRKIRRIWNGEKHFRVFPGLMCEVGYYLVLVGFGSGAAITKRWRVGLFFLILPRQSLRTSVQGQLRTKGRTRLTSHALRSPSAATSCFDEDERPRGLAPQWLDPTYTWALQEMASGARIHRPPPEPTRVGESVLLPPKNIWTTNNWFWGLLQLLEF